MNVTNILSARRSSNRSSIASRITALLAVAVLHSAMPAGAFEDPAEGRVLGGPIVKKPQVKLLAADTATPAAPAPAEPTEAPKSLGELTVDLSAVRQLKVAGQSIDEVPLRVGNLDMLAPIVPNLTRIGASATRVAVENIPGNPNTPTQDKLFQINLPQSPPIVLSIGRATAHIGTNEIALRAAPLVIRDKIWLPIFSLAPLMGAAVRLDANGVLHMNPTIQSVELFPVKGTVALTVKTSSPIAADSVSVGTLENPPKLYIDFRGYSMGFDAAYSTAERVVSSGLGDVEKVRVGLFQTFPDTTRVVLDLKKDMIGYNQPLPDKTLYALVLNESGEGSIGATPSMLNPVPSNGSLRGLTIVVDAGHGGHDGGAPGARSREKDLTLDIARRVRNHLMARGATVLMTRDGDYFISLQGRVDFANSRKADIFFSVHINSFQKTSSGTETFYWTAPSQTLAREVQNELAKATGLRSRGISQARFFVIRKTTMPSVLTESAFITNPKEEALLINPKWRERVARGMAQGIANYVARFMRPAAISG